MPKGTAAHTGAFVSLAVVWFGASMAALPALALQIAVVMGTAVAATTVMLARVGRVLNPAWVLVSMLYLIGPIGGIFSQTNLMRLH